jgi:hypothetical protein
VYSTYNRSHILVLQTLARFLLGASQAPSYSGQAVSDDDEKNDESAE